MSMSCRLAVALVFVVVACFAPDNVRRLATEPVWMEWPAEVRAGQPFEVRAVFSALGCYARQELRVSQERTTTAVSIRSEWVVEGENSPLCLADPGYVDTVLTIPGLAATSDRTFDIVPVHPDKPAPRPVGSILVRPTAPLNTDRSNGLGHVVGTTDIEGCAVILPPFSAPVPVDNPPGTEWVGYISGYFFTPAAPLCGQARAFRVVEGL